VCVRDSAGGDEHLDQSVRRQLGTALRRPCSLAALPVPPFNLPVPIHDKMPRKLMNARDASPLQAQNFGVSHVVYVEGELKTRNQVQIPSTLNPK
jgi:hypothetical protein